ncbi:hypothetical protein ACF8C6_15265 [Pseudomonas sp. zbq_18]|uniref:hypothetical protein n=1 Tax=Pseudomonas sp. zbq_18 TaxID=3367251 RepID=UPI00370BAFC2
MGFFYWLPAQAEERWVVAVAELPGLAERDASGPLLAQLELLDRQLDGVSLEVRVVPFARSLLLVRQGQADLQMPYIGLPQAPAGLRYGRQPLGQVSFALYSRRMEPLRREQLQAVRFADYQALWLVADSARGAAIEQRFSAALRVLRANGELERVAPALLEQEHWQPWP